MFTYSAVLAFVIIQFGQVGAVMIDIEPELVAKLHGNTATRTTHADVVLIRSYAMFKDEDESVSSGVFHNFQGFLSGHASSGFFLAEPGSEVDFQAGVERVVAMAIEDSADTWVDGQVGAGMNDSFDFLARQYIRPWLEIVVIGLHGRANKIPA